ncbi:unnamed protein product [Moneuplotes crassus]|uniref:CCT domain-containing protein n=1 Tax=Euplotes crassus TaxID=5936 RepID=A0AAD1UKG2_EUPCR|nr:unnamed protein product [Moneuplotes crassus]
MIFPQQEYITFAVIPQQIFVVEYAIQDAELPDLNSQVLSLRDYCSCSYGYEQVSHQQWRPTAAPTCGETQEIESISNLDLRSKNHSGSEISKPSRIVMSGIFNKNTVRSNLAKEGKLVGFYTQKERRLKIARLRQKQKRRRQLCPISKRYSGRRRSAFQKPRKGGRFVKSELAHLYALTEAERLKRTEIIDSNLAQGNYEEAVSFLIEY